MSAPTYTPEERVQKFLESFHHTSNLREWPEIRKLMWVDKLAEGTFRLNTKTGLVELRGSPIAYRDAFFAGAQFRKFMTRAEPVYLPRVVSSARQIGLTGHVVDEVESQADQTVSPRFEFLVSPQTGESVGLKMKELPGPVRWKDETDITSPKWHALEVSTRDATEVFFNEGALHPREEHRSTPARDAIRSAPQVYQTFLAHVAIASTVYAAGSLHMALNDSGDKRWQCGSFCQERVMLEHLRKTKDT